MACWQYTVESHLKYTIVCQKVQTRVIASLNSNPFCSVADSAEVIDSQMKFFRLKREKEELLEQLQFKTKIAMAHDLRN